MKNLTAPSHIDRPAQLDLPANQATKASIRQAQITDSSSGGQAPKSFTRITTSATLQQCCSIRITQKGAMEQRLEEHPQECWLVLKSSLGSYQLEDWR
ncbi:unnamed protein product [Calypogeia fissa]